MQLQMRMLALCKGHHAAFVATGEQQQKACRLRTCMTYVKPTARNHQQPRHHQSMWMTKSGRGMHSSWQLGAIPEGKTSVDHEKGYINIDPNDDDPSEATPAAKASVGEEASAVETAATLKTESKEGQLGAIPEEKTSVDHEKGYINIDPNDDDPSKATPAAEASVGKEASAVETPATLKTESKEGQSGGVVEFISEAIGRVFSPNKDENTPETWPATGYTGDLPDTKKKSETGWAEIGVAEPKKTAKEEGSTGK